MNSSNNTNTEQTFRIESNAEGFSIRIYRDGLPKDADLPNYVASPLDLPEVLPELVNWLKGHTARSMEISIPLTKETLAALVEAGGNAELVWAVQHVDGELHPVSYHWQAVKKL